VVAAYLALNVVLSAYRWVPRTDPIIGIVPTIEASFLALVVSLFAGWGRKQLRIARGVLTPLVGCLIIYSWAEALYQYYYSRHFTPWTDVRFVRGGVLLLLGPVEGLVGPATVLAVVLIVGAGAAGAWFMLGWLSSSTRRTRSPLLVSALSAVLAVSAIAVTGPPRSLTAIVAENSLPPSARSTGESEAAGDGSGVTAGDTTPERSSHETTIGYPVLQGGDLHLFFVESYGRAAFSRAEIAAEIVPLLRRHEDELAEAGYAIASGFLEAPVVGGYSWVAEAAFLTGTDISNQAEYDAALRRDMDTLPRIMNEAGYLALLSMPGTVHGEWPEAKSFYGFEHTMLAPDFEYQGPMHSFVPIPDQLAIAQTYARLTALRESEQDRPAFVQHVLVSSHAPYNRIPPYIDDWSEIGDGEVYNRLETTTFDNDWFSGKEFVSGYVAALSYSLTVVHRFLSEVVRESAAAIIVGDHQPGPQVRPADATAGVPVHIVSRSEPLVNGFFAHGYVPGIVPTQPPPHDPSHRFLQQLLDALGADRLHGDNEKSSPEEASGSRATE
jgi:hypothetical protein